MRGVAGRLETGPSSLYTFVGNQRELHVLVLDSIAGMVPLPATGGSEAVVELLMDYAKRLHGFPGAARLALLTPPTGPAFLNLFEAGLRHLVDEGFSLAAAERVCDALFLMVTACIAEQQARDSDHPAQSIPDLYREAVDTGGTAHPYLAAALAAVDDQSGEQRLAWCLRAFLAGAKQLTSSEGDR
jgi:hypothetical protein